MIWPDDDIDDPYEHQRDRTLQEQAEREKLPRLPCAVCGATDYTPVKRTSGICPACWKKHIDIP
jgi:hypothetical protein